MSDRATLSGADVTVVIPTYNRARLIAQALESVQAQTTVVKDIIVVDDGSTDATADVVARFTRADSRVRLVAQANAGANVARNTGIGEARSDWIAFLDSDDRWLPDKIERQIAALRARPEAVASFTGIIAVDGDRELYRYDMPGELTLGELRRHNALGSTSTALVSRAVLEKVGGFDPVLPSCQDWDLWLRLRREGPFAVVTDSLILYDDGPHDRITGNLAKAIEGHRRVFARALADVDDRRERAGIAASHATVLMRIYDRNARRLDTARQAGRALALEPTWPRLKALVRSVVRMV